MLYALLMHAIILFSLWMLSSGFLPIVQQALLPTAMAPSWKEEALG
jgi:hypothetical protein